MLALHLYSVPFLNCQRHAAAHVPTSTGFSNAEGLAGVLFGLLGEAETCSAGSPSQGIVLAHSQCLVASSYDFVAGSVMSIRNYFWPSNRLSEPTGSISIALKSRGQGTSLITVHSIVPPSRKNSKHTRDTFLWQMLYDSSFSQPQCINR